MMAARCGAAVCSIEISPIIADCTHGTIGYFQQERDLIGARTQDMKLCTSDVRLLSYDGPDGVGQHDVVLCELMDASGVGESVLGVLEHACQHFALPGAQVIPCRLKLYASVGYMRMPQCHGALSFEALNPFFFCAQRGGSFSMPETPAVVQASCRASPTVLSGMLTKNLSRLARGEIWDVLTDEVEVVCFDISSMLDGQSLYPTHHTVELAVQTGGLANCVHWWWSADLDEHNTISNRPGSGTHWLQPLVPVGPLHVQVGNRLTLRMSIGDGQRIEFSLCPAPGFGWGTSAVPLLKESQATFISKWSTWLDEVCTAQKILIEKYSMVGDIEGLCNLQRAVMATFRKVRESSGDGGEGF